MIVLGRIVAPYGLQGWVRVHPFADDPRSWGKVRAWWLGTDPEGDSWRETTLKATRWHGDTLVARLDGVDDRTAAERLEGCYVGLPREIMPAPDDGEFYWADLVGLSVCNESGDRLGRVAGLIETGAHDVLQVRDGERERLLPFVAAVVKQVDLGGGCIRVAWEADW